MDSEELLHLFVFYFVFYRKSLNSTTTFYYLLSKYGTIKDLQLWSLTIQRTRNYCDISDKNTIWICYLATECNAVLYCSFLMCTFQPTQNCKRKNETFWWQYRIYPAVRQGFFPLEWLQITKSVLWNFAIIPILPFLNNPKDLDLSCKMDLDLWDCFGRKLHLITKEI